MANMAQAIRMALHLGEERYGVTDIFGEDVGAPLGGVFTVTQGLKTTWNTPLDERGIVGTAIGLALAGQQPVAEIQFVDYIFNTIDLLKLAGNSCWSSNGMYPLNIVLMTPHGAGIHGSLYHSHSFDAIATHLPGWKIVMPSDAYDAFGLMLSAIKDPNPVMFLKPKALLRDKGRIKIPGEPDGDKELRDMIDAPLGDARIGWKPRWPDLEEFFIPLGKANTVRQGEQATIFTYGRHVHMAVSVAEDFAAQGLGDVEVVDLRSLHPYDWDVISEAAKKHGRIMFVNEDTEITNFGEHLIRRLVEEHFYLLRAKPRLVAGLHVPGIGLSPDLEHASVPQKDLIAKELKALLSELT